MECLVSGTNRNIDTLGQGMCSRPTLRDQTCLWTELLHSPNRMWGSRTSQDVNAFLRLWVRIEGNSCGLCVWGTVPLPQKGTLSAHASPWVHTWSLILGSTAQHRSGSNHSPISCQVLNKNGGFFLLDHLGETSHHLSDGLSFCLHKSEPSLLNPLQGFYISHFIKSQVKTRAPGVRRTGRLP